MSGNDIENEIILDRSERVDFHITYDEPLTVKEFTEILNAINMGINDANRSQGVTNSRQLGDEFAPRIEGVKEGSIILSVIIKCLGQIALSVIANYIFQRLEMKFGDKEGRIGHFGNLTINIINFPITINISIGNRL